MKFAIFMLAAVSAGLAAADAVLVLPAAWRSQCEPASACSVQDGAVRISFDEKARSARLLDGDQKVRIEFPDTQAGNVLKKTNQWVQGRSAYAAQCVRCHGADGADTSYPNIKPLAGIGKRYTVDEISVRMTKTGNTDLSRFSKQEKLALAGYVATL